MRFKSRVIGLVSFMLICPLLTKVGYPQNLVVSNPADIYDAKANFINPAVVPFQDAQFLVGLKVFHVGFLKNNNYGFRNGFFSLATPFVIGENLGVGLNGQYFTTPLYNQSNFSLLFGQKIFNALSLGLKFNLFTKSYNQQNFDLIDAYDPVFAQGTLKIAYSAGVGGVFCPLADLCLAVSIDHLNRPDVSLSGDNVPQPRVIDFGLRYNFRFLSVSLNLNHVRKDILLNFMIESHFRNIGTVKIGYESNSAKIEGQMHILKGVSLNYSYEYPLYDLNDISTGSHQLSIIYQLERIPGLHGRKKPGTEFRVNTSVNYLEIIEKRITRIIDEQVSPNEIVQLTAMDLGVLDSSQTDSIFYMTPPQLAISNAGNGTPRTYSKSYESSLNSLAEQLKERRKVWTEIVASPVVDGRAIEIRNYLINKRGVSPEKVKLTYVDQERSGNAASSRVSHIIMETESLTLLSPDNITFEFVPLSDMMYIREWHLFIYNSLKELVKRFDGRGQVPSQIRWDWRKGDGTLIEPDRYFYVFQWIDQKNRERKTKPGWIDVRKIKRNLTVEVTKRLKDLDKHVIKYDLKLNN